MRSVQSSFKDGFQRSLRSDLDGLSRSDSDGSSTDGFNDLSRLDLGGFHGFGWLFIGGLHLLVTAGEADVTAIWKIFIATFRPQLPFNKNTTL